jgi:beta-lactamase superfamily II metal-dependent hydrolase
MRTHLRLFCLILLVIVSSTFDLRADVTAVVKDEADPCAQLRVAPKSTAKAVRCLAPGTNVTVLASSPYWRKVKTPENSGWVAKKLLRTTGGTAAADGDQWLEIHIVDVGQGDGIWIHTADDGIDNGRFEGKNIVIDGGPDTKDAGNAFFQYLQRFAHKDAVIDALLISHPHADHYRGANSVLNHYQVKTIYDSGFPKGGTEYPNFRQKLKDEPDAKVMIGRDAFEPLEWGTELQAEILYSFGIDGVDLGSAANTKENNSSMVLRLQYGDETFLFMGDAEGKDRHGSAATPRFVEDFLLKNVPRERLKANVLKIAHHGSETSSTTDFIAAVDPDAVVVSSGRKDFGRGNSHVFLPDESTLARYCCHNPETRIYRTDQDDEAEGHTDLTDADGDHIVIRTNGKTIIVEALSGGVPITMEQCLPGCPNQ